jgi:hypothetical protein
LETQVSRHLDHPALPWTGDARTRVAVVIARLAQRQGKGGATVAAAIADVVLHAELGIAAATPIPDFKLRTMLIGFVRAQAVVRELAGPERPPVEAPRRMSPEAVAAAAKAAAEALRGRG